MWGPCRPGRHGPSPRATCSLRRRKEVAWSCLLYTSRRPGTQHHAPGQRPPARLPVPGEQRPHPAPRARRHASGWPVLACRLSSRPPHGHAAASCLLPPKCIPRGLAAPCWLRHLHPRGADETPPHHPVLLRPVGGSTLSKMPSPSPQGQPSRSRQLKVTEMPQWAHVAFQSDGPCSQAKDGSQPHF